MKTFNRKKWEAIQRRKAELHEIYRSWSDKRDHASSQYGRRLSSFATNFKSCEMALTVIKQDERTLTAIEIDEKIEQMIHQWPTVCESFNLSPEFVGKSHLIDLYKALLEITKIKEGMTLAAERQNAFGACFTVLNEFAAKHGKGDQTTYDPVPVTVQSWEMR